MTAAKINHCSTCELVAAIVSKLAAARRASERTPTGGGLGGGLGGGDGGGLGLFERNVEPSRWRQAYLREVRVATLALVAIRGRRVALGCMAARDSSFDIATACQEMRAVISGVTATPRTPLVSEEIVTVGFAPEI